MFILDFRQLCIHTDRKWPKCKRGELERIIYRSWLWKCLQVFCRLPCKHSALYINNGIIVRFCSSVTNPPPNAITFLQIVGWPPFKFGKHLTSCHFRSYVAIFCLAPLYDEHHELAMGSYPGAAVVIVTLMGVISLYLSAHLNGTDFLLI